MLVSHGVGIQLRSFVRYTSVSAGLSRFPRSPRHWPAGGSLFLGAVQRGLRLLPGLAEIPADRIDQAGEVFGALAVLARVPLGKLRHLRRVLRQLAKS